MTVFLFGYLSIQDLTPSTSRQSFSESWYNYSMKLLLTLTILFSYIGLIFSAPVHFIQMAGMDVPMAHCPFAEGEHSICAMTPFDHMKAWRTFAFATLAIFVLTIGLHNFSKLFVVSNLSLFVNLYLSRLRRLRRKYVSYLEMLFATGVLHPKIP